MNTPAEKQIKKADATFAETVAGYELFGKVLEPFSAMRQAVASNLGLRFGIVDEADIYNITVQNVKDGKKTPAEIQLYNNLYADCIYVLWLCSVPSSRVLRALRKQDEARKDAFAWADDNGMQINSLAYYEGVAIFFQIMIAVVTATSKPKLDNISVSGDDEDSDPNE
jgi:geranylgeranyl pyrophosphate synthase